MEPFSSATRRVCSEVMYFYFVYFTNKHYLSKRSQHSRDRENFCEGRSFTDAYPRLDNLNQEVDCL